MANCDPCKFINCVNTPDLAVYSLSGLPPTPLPPAPNPPPLPFTNDEVFFNPDCPGGSVLTYSGTLPAWISIDLGTNQLVGAAGTFRGATKAAANAAAQAALDTFANAAVLANTLTCATGGDCTGADTNEYGITGYVDGFIPNPGQPTPVGGESIWDGTFIYKNNANSCMWMSCYDGSPVLIMDGHKFCVAEIRFFFGSWILTVFTWNGDPTPIWEGTKTSGTTPAGVYTLSSGSDATPATVTVGSIGPGATDQTEVGCKPS